MSAPLFLRRAAVIDTTRNHVMALADTTAEAEVLLASAMRGIPAGRIEALGLRVKAVIVHIEVLPDPIDPARQGDFFHEAPCPSAP